MTRLEEYGSNSGTQLVRSILVALAHCTCQHLDPRRPDRSWGRRCGRDRDDMGCNVSKDVKVDEQQRTEGDGQADCKTGQKDSSCEGRSRAKQHEDKAATKIQASFRGYKTRKELSGSAKNNMKANSRQPPPQEQDMDLTDPDLSKAATKIQASFRGHKVRKDMMTTNTPDSHPSKTEEEVDVDDDMKKAATKIQATFRGYKVRKNKDPE